MKKPIFLSRTFWRRRLNMFTDEDCMTSSDKLFRLSSRMRVMKHNWSARKQATASSSAECSHDKPPSSFVRGQDSTMWDIIWVSQQGHRSVSASLHFLLQALQCFCSVREWFSRDHCCRGMSKPGCQIVGSHTRWELTTWADLQLCLHRLLMSADCKSSHSGFLDVSRRNGGLRISVWIGQLSCFTIFSAALTTQHIRSLGYFCG